MKITAPQRVEKGVDLEMQTILHAEETSRNRAEFLFCEWVPYNGTAPEQKTESTNAA